MRDSYRCPAGGKRDGEQDGRVHAGSQKDGGSQETPIVLVDADHRLMPCEIPHEGLLRSMLLMRSFS